MVYTQRIRAWSWLKQFLLTSTIVSKKYALLRKMDDTHIGLGILGKYLYGEAGLKASSVSTSACRCDGPYGPSDPVSSTGQWWANLGKWERVEDYQGSFPIALQKFQLYYKKLVKTPFAHPVTWFQPSHKSGGSASGGGGCSALQSSKALSRWDLCVHDRVGMKPGEMISRCQSKKLTLVSRKLLTVSLPYSFCSFSVASVAFK